jgi:hypothetical protein
MGQFLDYRPGPGDGNEWSYPGDGGGVSNTANFTVSAALPTSLALSELTGAAGDTVTITGSGFGSGGTVTFNGVPASASSWSNAMVVTQVTTHSKRGALL